MFVSVRSVSMPFSAAFVCEELNGGNTGTEPGQPHASNDSIRQVIDSLDGSPLANFRNSRRESACGSGIVDDMARLLSYSHLNIIHR
jgi:hypothetical protein